MAIKNHPLGGRCLNFFTLINFLACLCKSAESQPEYCLRFLTLNGGGLRFCIAVSGFQGVRRQPRASLFCFPNRRRPVSSFRICQFPERTSIFFSLLS